ncbi:MAG: GNAT family N-acetyltransferase [Rhizobiales bacterium]|nr:GNAT family N-acetyltransferase [Hyphomicrobiales bacterium]MBO6699664.1 GNAT family N-acetyltransferase [Hyphomicrobiales bacterium]MBO6737202.1 GNAT family N-acetyltransferase [Hyphomicrobiales bacterium]MBO6911724.1 GNAT family N-acetyltransferase [Hyphomicrobiales bacterium]MBO6954854.1 GNAT family N-acetyltransferase [Hyphomicrobiales bacterium]
MTSKSAVSLRPYQLNDADRLAVLLNDPDVTAMTASIPYPYARSDAEAFLSNARNEEGRLVGRAIVLNGELVGGVGLGPRPNGREELGYWVGKAYWGQGIATRAVALFLDVLRENGIEGPIHAATVRSNEASQKVLLSNGFVFTGEGECITPARDTPKQPSNDYMLEAL